jgi:hypothetical protein
VELSVKRLAVVIGLALAAVAALVLIIMKQREAAEETATLDRAIASARATPMVGVVLDDVPGAADRLRAALEEERRQPTTRGVPRPLAFMGELRANHVVPALKATDEKSAAVVLAAREAMLRHLQKTDLALCKEFAVTGIQHAERLDETGQVLLRDTLSALEQAYRAGRAARARGATPAAVASEAQAHDLLVEAGFQPADFDRLGRLPGLSNDEACEVAIRFNDAPARLPPDKRAALTRYILTVQ